MKKAYVIAELQVTNPTTYEAYKPLSSATIVPYGGQFIVRGGQRDQREGEDAAHNGEWRTVVMEFPSLEQAQSWYDSDENKNAMLIRHANTIGRLFIVEGA